MGKIIAFANHKGGVGKTTSAVNVGACLTKFGFKTLLVDCDGQANLSEHLGYANSESTIYESIVKGAELPIIQIKENLDLIPSNLELVGAEAYLMSKPVGREIILKQVLEPVRDQYDWIILDCPPNLGQMTINALSAADEVIVPMQPERFPEKGLDSLTDVMVMIQQSINPKLQLRGIFFTFYNAQTVLHGDLRKRITQTYPDKVFSNTIRRNVSLAEAVEREQTIFDYDKNSLGAKDYEQLTEEIFKEELKGINA